MAQTEGQDALSERSTSSTAPSIDFDLIERGPERAARAEIAKALRLLQSALNQYIARKGA